MSNHVQGMAKKKVVGDRAAKAVLMHMADSASDDGSGIWTSKNTIAKELETSLPTVKRAIARLVEMGLIFEAGKKKCQNGYTILYGIDLAKLGALDPVHHEPPQGETRFTMNRDPVHHDPRPGSPRPPNHYGTTKEPESQETLFSENEVSKVNPPRRKTAKMFPDDWSPSDTALAFAEENGFNKPRALVLAGACVDHHRGKGNKFVDHNAAFKTWIRNEVKYTAMRQGAATTSGGDRPNASRSAIMQHQEQLRGPNN